MKFKESSLQKFSLNISQKLIKSSLHDSESTVFATNPNLESPYRADSVYVAYSQNSDHTGGNSNQSDRSSDRSNSAAPRLSVRDDSFTDLRESLLEP